MPKPTTKPKAKPLFNIRISGQIEAASVKDAYRIMGEHCQRAAKPGEAPRGELCHGNDEPSPLVEGGIFRITPAEGA